MFAIIQAAGWPIWPLLLASVIAVALIIERAVTLRSSKVIPSTLLEQVLTVYQRQGVSEDVLAKLAQDSPLGEVLAAGLRNRSSSRYVMREAVEEAGRKLEISPPIQASGKRRSSVSRTLRSSAETLNTGADARNNSSSTRQH